MKQLGIETRIPTDAGGAAAQSQSWLSHLEVTAVVPMWEVTISLDDGPRPPTAYLHVAIEAHEWSVRFERGSELSWIRVRGAPIVYLRDDFRIIDDARALYELPRLVRGLEARFGIEFRRQHAAIHGDVHDPRGAIRRWVERF